MATQHDAVFGIFHSDNEVKTKMDILLSRGFSNSNIKVLYPTTELKLDIGRIQRTMMIPFAKIGAVVGAIVLFTIGLAVLLSFFGTGPSVSIGFLNGTSLLFVAIIFGIFFGASGGALVGIGTPQPIVLRFVRYIKAGATILSVKVINLEEEGFARKMFEACGACDITIMDENQTWKSIYKNIG